MAGGGGGATSVTGLPTWAQPAVESSLNKAVNLEQAGGFSHVENLSSDQQAALTRQNELGGRGGTYDQIATDAYGAGQAYRDAAAGAGLFGADALGQQSLALQNTIGQAQQGVLGQAAGNFSQSGNLGGARAEAAANQAALQVGGELAANELANRRQASLAGAQGTIGSTGTLQQGFGTGAATQLGVGQTLQEQGQREGDAAYQGVQRLFGLLGSPAVGSKTTQTGGGGK